MKGRDKRFVAVHRGGPLSREHHNQLIIWATDCAEHVFPFFEDQSKAGRLLDALGAARAWAKGKISVGEARKASLGAIAVANESVNQAAIAVARAIGHAVATAHMADHSLGAAEYALKAVKAIGGATDSERIWQDDHLPPQIKELVLSARNAKRFMPKRLQNTPSKYNEE